MRHHDVGESNFATQALWERLLRCACSAKDPQERLSCLLTPLSHAPNVGGALVDGDGPAAIRAVHPAGWAPRIPLSLPDSPTARTCWWLAPMDGSPEGPSSVAVVRKCSDGRLRALIAWADLPAEELQARLREWGPALATALCLPPGVPAVNPASVADPLEMARYVSAALGHDMRNIMSGIIGALELHRSAGQGVGEEVFDAVRRRAVEGVAMVEAMMGRLRTSQPEPAETVDLAAVVSDFKRDIEPLGQAMAASGVTFQTNGQPAQVAVDRSELYRALLALVFNSWRACRHGGAVEVVTEVRRGRAALEVRDDGEGMDPEVHRRAKEPFYTTEPDHHWGLGLTIAEEVAKQAHGSLMIRPREDRGTTVTLSLPLIEGTTGQHTPHRAPGGNKP